MPHTNAARCVAAVLVGPALSAQAPVSEMDAHIAAAKAAAASIIARRS